jgi:hypothetical protein
MTGSNFLTFCVEKNGSIADLRTLWRSWSIVDSVESATPAAPTCEGLSVIYQSSYWGKLTVSHDHLSLLIPIPPVA